MWSRQHWITKGGLSVPVKLGHIQFVWRKLIPDVLFKKELERTTVNIGKIGTFSTLRLALFLFKIMYWGVLCITKSAQNSSSDSGRRCYDSYFTEK